MRLNCGLFCFGKSNQGIWNVGGGCGCNNQRRERHGCKCGEWEDCFESCHRPCHRPCERRCDWQCGERGEWQNLSFYGKIYFRQDRQNWGGGYGNSGGCGCGYGNNAGIGYGSGYGGGVGYGNAYPEFLQD